MLQILVRHNIPITTLQNKVDDYFHFTYAEVKVLNSSPWVTQPVVNRACCDFLESVFLH